LDIGLIRRALIVTLGVACLAASAATAVSAVIRADLTAQQAELTRQIAIARTTAGAAHVAAAGSLAAAQRTLEKRKRELPSTVVILEALSQMLPDHTYVTELRLEGDKVRLIGVTRDAPSLIGLIERSDQFGAATFFAPTTQSQSNQGEVFHIETAVRRTGGLPS
jgi:general secretion pathway protein L